MIFAPCGPQLVRESRTAVILPWKRRQSLVRQILRAIPLAPSFRMAAAPARTATEVFLAPTQQASRFFSAVRSYGLVLLRAGTLAQPGCWVCNSAPCILAEPHARASSNSSRCSIYTRNTPIAAAMIVGPATIPIKPNTSLIAPHGCLRFACRSPVAYGSLRATMRGTERGRITSAADVFRICLLSGLRCVLPVALARSLSYRSGSQGGGEMCARSCFRAKIARPPGQYRLNARPSVS